MERLRAKLKQSSTVADPIADAACSRQLDMDHFEARERVKFLRMHLARLQAANELYLNKRSHSPSDVVTHRQRQERLHDILKELAEISSRIKAA